MATRNTLHIEGVHQHSTGHPVLDALTQHKTNSPWPDASHCVNILNVHRGCTRHPACTSCIFVVSGLIPTVAHAHEMGEGVSGDAAQHRTGVVFEKEHQ